MERRLNRGILTAERKVSRVRKQYEKEREGGVADVISATNRLPDSRETNV